MFIDSPLLEIVFLDVVWGLSSYGMNNNIDASNKMGDKERNQYDPSV